MVARRFAAACAASIGLILSACGGSGSSSTPESTQNLSSSSSSASSDVSISSSSSVVSSSSSQSTSSSVAVEQRFDIGVDANSGGRVTPVFATVLEGESAEFSLLPDEGYELASVTGCDGVLTGTTYTVESATRSCTVQARFVALPPLPEAFQYSYQYTEDRKIEFVSGQSTHATTKKIVQIDAFGYREVIEEFTEGSQEKSISVFLLDAVNNEYLVQACNSAGCTDGDLQWREQSALSAVKVSQFSSYGENQEFLALSENGEFAAFYVERNADECDMSIDVMRYTDDQWVLYHSIPIDGQNSVINAHFSADNSKMLILPGPLASCSKDDVESSIEDTVVVRYFDLDAKEEKTPILVGDLVGVDYWGLRGQSRYSSDGRWLTMTYPNTVVTFQLVDDQWVFGGNIPPQDSYTPVGNAALSHDGERLVVASAEDLSGGNASLQKNNGAVSHSFPPQTCELDYCFGALHIYEFINGSWQLEAELDARVVDLIDAVDGTDLQVEVDANADKVVLSSWYSPLVLTHTKVDGQWIRNEDYYLPERPDRLALSENGERLIYCSGEFHYLYWIEGVWSEMPASGDLLSSRQCESFVQFGENEALYLGSYRTSYGGQTEYGYVEYLYQY